MRLSEFKEEPKQESKAVNGLDVWEEADIDEYMSWNLSRQLRYCFSRDMFNARHAASVSEAEWYRNRAAKYLEDARQAAIKEQADAAKTGNGWIMHMG